MNQLPQSADSPMDLVRRLENMVRLGTVAEVQHAAPARCRVRSGDLLTDWLPWLARRAGGAVEWHPPTVGEQCVVLSPGGDLLQGVVFLGAYSDAHPQNSESPTEHRLTWDNGDYMAHDSATGELRIQCSGAVRIAGDTVHLN